MPCTVYPVPYTVYRVPCDITVPCTVNFVPCPLYPYRVPCTFAVYPLPLRLPYTLTACLVLYHEQTGIQGNRRLGVLAKLPPRGFMAPHLGTDPGKGERHTRGNPRGVPVRGGTATSKKWRVLMAVATGEEGCRTHLVSSSCRKQLWRHIGVFDASKFSIKYPTLIMCSLL